MTIMTEKGEYEEEEEMRVFRRRGRQMYRNLTEKKLRGRVYDRDPAVKASLTVDCHMTNAAE